MLGKSLLHLGHLLGRRGCRCRLLSPLYTQSLQASSHCCELRGHRFKHLGLICHGACEGYSEGKGRESLSTREPDIQS